MSRRQTKQWLAELHPTMFSNLWQVFSTQHLAQRGWLQLEILKRFPEFTKWVHNLEDPNEMALYSRYDDDHGGNMVHEPPPSYASPKARGAAPRPSK